MLEPLELLRLAGTRVTVAVRFVVEAVCNDLFTTGTDEDVCGFNGIFLTVFVDTALFKDERELLKLVLELLLSTAVLRFAIGGVAFWTSVLLSEFVRRGVVFRLRNDDGGALVRIDRLRSNVCWFLVSNVCS